MIGPQNILAQFISSLPDAAFRSLALALAVWAGLRLFRVRSVLALKSAWTFVLFAACLMPLLLPISSRWPRATLVLPAFASRSAPEATVSTTEPQSSAPEVSRPIAPAAPFAAAETAAPAAVRVGRFTPPTMDRAPFSALPLPVAPAPSTSAAASPALSPFEILTFFYCAIAALLLVRLFYGLVSALRLWRAADPVSAEALAAAGGLRLRASAAVSSPLTVGSGVLLPADYSQWDSEKLRIVLAHERSHVRQGDFYLQALAGLYAAVVWASPLGWWLKRQLSDLAEAIGDRSGLAEAGSRSSYAQILLEFAAAPRPAVIGVAMARSSNLSHRMERLFNDRAFRQAFAVNRRTRVAAVLVPAAMLAATTLVRVQASTQTPQPTAPASSPATVTGVIAQSHADSAPPAVAPDAAPDALRTPPQTEPAPAPAPGLPQPRIAPPHVPVPGVHVDVPAVHVTVPAQHIHIPAVHVNAPAMHFDVPAVQVNIPATHVEVPAQRIDVPAERIEAPGKQLEVPAIHIEVPATHIDVPSVDTQDGSTGHAAYGPAGQAAYGPAGRAAYGSAGQAGGQLVAMLNGSGHAMILSASSGATLASFDRTFSLSGKADLHIANGAGNIRLTRGAANQVHVRAIIRSNSSDDAEEVRELAANPPIQQEGNTIRIGGRHGQGPNHIVIDYEIEAPADAALEATAGSGNIADTGVGQAAKLMSGSGNITATGIQDGFAAMTGSGNISIENTGKGDAKVQTGSGNVDVKGVNGALKAETGSGNIKAQGTPVTRWKLETGSGNVEFWPGSAPLTLDASTGSGTIKSDRPMAMPTGSDRHHVHSSLNGGGPEVRLETGSGDIHIH